MILQDNGILKNEHSGWAHAREKQIASLLCNLYVKENLHKEYCSQFQL